MKSRPLTSRNALKRLNTLEKNTFSDFIKSPTLTISRPRPTPYPRQMTSPKMFNSNFVREILHIQPFVEEVELIDRKGEPLNKSVCLIDRVEDLKEGKLLKEVKVKLDAENIDRIVDRYKSTVSFSEYGKPQLYLTKDIDSKNIMYEVVQDIKGQQTFNKLATRQYLNIEQVMMQLLKHERQNGVKLTQQRTYITRCFVKHEMQFQDIL